MNTISTETAAQIQAAHQRVEDVKNRIRCCGADGRNHTARLYYFNSQVLHLVFTKDQIDNILAGQLEGAEAALEAANRKAASELLGV